MKYISYARMLVSGLIAALAVASTAGVANAQATTSWDGSRTRNGNGGHQHDHGSGMGVYPSNNTQGWGGGHGHGTTNNYQTFIGRAMNIQGDSFTLYSSSGLRYHVFFNSGFQTWNNHGGNVRWSLVRPGDMVRVTGRLRGGVVYATQVRDLSR